MGELSEPTKQVTPKEHSAKICIWSDLSVSDMDLINEASTAEKVRQELARIFDMGDYEEDPKTEVLMELYFNVIQFARTKYLSKEQTSCLFSIVKKTHEVAMETPYGNLMQTFRYFEGLVLCHSVKRPPYSIDIFKPDEVRMVVQFVLDTYFRHFKMYKFVFTAMVRLDLTLTYVNDQDKTIEDEETKEPTLEAEKSDVSDKTEEPIDVQIVDTEAKPDNEVADTTEAQPCLKGPNPVVKELKGMIRNFLTEQMKLLKTEVEQQLKTTEDTITTKIQDAEIAPAAKPRKKSAKK